MKVRLLSSAIASLLLSACDSGVHLGWEKDFVGGVDDQCVERALQSVSPEVSRTYYISEGDRGFPSGTEVTQFSYPDPVTHNDYSLDLAILANSKTHYVHRWTKIGTEIPDAERAKVLPLLLQANEAVESACGLLFAGSKPTVGPG